MSITSAKTGATGISLALENNFMEPIASVLVGAGESGTITFSDIPQGYKHLQIRGIAQVTYPSDPGGSGGLGVWFNNDFSANYTRHELNGDGSSVYVYAVAPTSEAAMQRFLYRNTNNSIYGVAICDILDYANPNKFKTIRNIGGFDTNATSGQTGDVYLNSALWRSTDPISSITIGSFSYKMKQYSRFSLYGIKG